MIPARVALIVAVTGFAIPAPAADLQTPLLFFQGRTEMTSVVRVIMSGSYRSRTTGSGKIESDGSLALVQSVYAEGKPPHTRSWKIRQVGAGHFIGTMSEATTPVDIQEVRGNYRFRFRMKGNLAVEQWLSLLPDGQSAKSSMTVRKFGMRVATSSGTIRRV